jgi:precorrin-2 dehydrogenase/sirohydrochlorin ferrochelatase
MAAPLFPVFIKLADRPCLVVGAGEIALAKVFSLLQSGARITVVAPEAKSAIREMARSGRLVWNRRKYQPSDLAGAFLAIAGTSDFALNHEVFVEAERRGILCNAVDDPPNCDFYFPAIVRRGDLQIAISTAGASPALAQRLRKELNAALPADVGSWLEELGNLRREVLELEPLNDARRQLLHTLATREVCGFDACPSRAYARSHALTNPRKVEP